MKKPHLKIEKQFWQEGLLICGIDEVGRGCLAGPVVAAAVVMPQNHRGIKNVRDSKLLTKKMREEVCDEILDKCLDFGIGLVPAARIDEIGITKATREAMEHAVSQISCEYQKIFVDGIMKIETEKEQETVVSGDAIIYSISCSSIIAKVFRDRVVVGLSAAFPEYGFHEHKGYATEKHRKALSEFGPSVEHRLTFLKNLH